MIRSFYAVIEGVDGSGKTTQAKRLEAQILQRCIEQPVLLTEPQKTLGTIGYEIRRRLAEGPALEPWEAIGLFVGDRIQQAKDEVEPNLRNGRIVIQDRNWLSTCVYQGRWDMDLFSVTPKTGQIAYVEPLYPHGQWLADYHARIMPRVNLMILLDVTPELAKNRLELRAKQTGRKLDQFDSGDQFEERRGRYRQLAKPHRSDGWWDACLVVDAGLSEDAVAEQIWNRVSVELLNRGRKIRQREGDRVAT